MHSNKQRELKIKLFLCALFSLSFFFAALFAQELDVPIELQLKLYARVLSFDHNVNQRLKESTKVAVLFQKKLRQSVLVKEEAEAFFKSNAWAEWETTQVEFHYFDVSNNDDLEEKLTANTINVVILMPVRNFDVSRLAIICRSIGASSFTPIPENLRMGLSLSVSLKNNKPSILLNLAAARAEGADFSANLLKIATIIE